MKFDVLLSTAFLYGELEEVIYMQQPECCSDNATGLKLKISLYGPKQATQCLAKPFEGFLSAKGFKLCHTDQCLYMKESNNRKSFVAFYVDNKLVIVTHEEDIYRFFFKR